ncbi:hypothetical protein SO802_009180 [Lithocarpus litseifolius]|uniref:Uncharacterized protein n=1 Tax=Lithocarpus litseifolius TaxID=425828 RepID=A0AAW2DD87_9ROSI
MVITFLLHPLSHYNSITEPRARFLSSLLERLTIDFPSHFILSIIDVYKDIVTRNKLIFPSAVMRILHHASVSYPEPPYFSVMCAIDAFQRMDARLDTLTTEMYQVNTHVSHIAQRQARLGGFIESPSPFSEASEDKDDGGDSNGDDADEDEASSFSSDEEMTASQ